MKHNIKLVLKRGESNWVQIENPEKYCLPTVGIESSDIKETVEALIKEFEHTDESLKPLFKDKLILWLENTNENDFRFSENEKIRDFIYEMF